MDIERSITLNAPSDQVWDLLANRFHEVGAWASAIDRSDALATRSSTTEVADRVCDTPDGVFKEKVTRFDEPARVFAYIAYEGLPGFVREGGNTWSVRALGEQRCEVRMHMRFDLKPLANVLMGWMLERQMARAAEGVLDDLKIYAETGRISERKQAALAKYRAKRAA